MSPIRAMERLHPTAIFLVDYAFKDDGAGPYISKWNTQKLGPQPVSFAKLIQDGDAAAPTEEEAERDAAKRLPLRDTDPDLTPAQMQRAVKFLLRQALKGR